jgi:hypothetical protein
VGKAFIQNVRHQDSCPEWFLQGLADPEGLRDSFVSTYPAGFCPEVMPFTAKLPFKVCLFEKK